MKQQNKKPKIHSKQSEEREIISNNKIDPDPCTISNNETASLVNLNGPQQFCSRLENLEQQLNTPIATASISNASSSNASSSNP